VQPPRHLVESLERTAQAGVLRFWNDLDDEGRRRLVRQLEAIDWAVFDDLRRAASSAAEGVDPAFLSVAATPPGPRLSPEDCSAAAWRPAGEEALAIGQVGAILVAGGQGSRLGCDGPKGVYPIGPVSQSTLFEILIGRLAAIGQRYGRGVPLAIMTSSATDADTRAYLEFNRFFGLDPDEVLVFRQADLPALSIDSLSMLLEAPDRVAMAPDGHGGMLRALSAAGGLDWFARRGIEHVSSFQVDNPLACPLDPAFLGMHLVFESDITTQVVEKQAPGERVGVVVESGGVCRIVEYSDLPGHLARERGPDGRLRFRSGSIAVHCFRLAFLAEAAAGKASLPLHLARKSVAFVDDSGERVLPKEPNAYKFERFIFDLFPLARRVTSVTIDPAEGFAPLKNPSGSEADSPEHVRRAMVTQARRLLERVGVAVAEGIDVELAPSVIDEFDLRHIASGSRIERPCVVGGKAVVSGDDGTPRVPT
jgi:UDP-N-acetylglucosamine/UDP-N-acetylgalactosamine diphosphorylase